MEVVGTDLVDAGSLLAAGVLLTLLHIAVTEPALQEQEPRISTQVLLFRQGAVSHSAVSSWHRSARSPARPGSNS